MPHRGVAVYAPNSVLIRGASRYDVVHEVSVTPKTRLLENLGIPRLDHDGLVKVL